MSTIRDFLLYVYKKFQTESCIIYNLENFPGEYYIPLLERTLKKNIRYVYDYTVIDEPIVRLYIN